MILPPRIKTLYPDTEAMVNGVDTPIPIESAFFLEDAEQDPSRMNRYYFKYPGNWITANNGETIIGVRNISVVPRRRKLEFTLSIRKYLRVEFEALRLKKENKVEVNINKSNDELYAMLGEKFKGEVSCHIISWLDNTHDLRELFRDIKAQLKSRFEKYNEVVRKKYNMDILKTIETQKTFTEKVKDNLFNFASMSTFGTAFNYIFKNKEELKKKKTEIEKYVNDNIENLIPTFHLEDNDSSINDIQMDGYYDNEKRGFVETLFSPLNVNVYSYVDETSTDKTTKSVNETNTTNTINTTNPSPIPTPPPKPYVNIDDKNDELLGSLYYIDFKINFNEKKTDENYTIYDFVDVLNIGKGPYQNDPAQYQNKWLRRLDFLHVWDRKPCKVYSSIAEQSNHGYIGNSEVEYSPIKYYKLRSTDQRFWIEFYSSAYHNIPVRIPKNESFCIEMQFLPYNKMLI